jgi:predicted GIY-YIG superfamily endonuclease
MEFVVYAIKSKGAERVYVGQTADLSVRLGHHNAGRVQSTKGGRPWFLVAVECFPNRSLARWQERALKKSLGARTRWIEKHAVGKKATRRRA